MSKQKYAFNNHWPYALYFEIIIVLPQFYSLILIWLFKTYTVYPKIYLLFNQKVKFSVNLPVNSKNIFPWAFLGNSYDKSALHFVSVVGNPAFLNL